MISATSPYLMSHQELRGVQLAELELLCEVDRVCRKTGIAYRITAGTLLGAVRHGGFIPWDDDADVVFTREEYERFRRACITELDTGRFYFQDQDNTPGYRWGYGKLRRRDSIFMRHGQENMPYEQGIFIDLFPCDYMPNNILLRTLTNAVCFLYRKAFWSAVGKHTAKGMERCVYAVLGAIPEKHLKANYARFVTRRNRRATGWLRTLTFPPPSKDYGYDSALWNETIEVTFEGHSLMTFARYEDYLTTKYGDYMALPPESERKTHPITYLKLPSANVTLDQDRM